jgi:hypothetical protein
VGETSFGKIADVDIDQLAPDEPLSPELVLVLSPKLRAQALARLGPPSWPVPRPRVVRAAPVAPRPRVVRAAPVAEVRFARSLGEILMARAVQLGVIFVFVTLLTLALSLVAQAFSVR